MKFAAGERYEGTLEVTLLFGDHSPLFGEPADHFHLVHVRPQVSVKLPMHTHTHTLIVFISTCPYCQYCVFYNILHIYFINISLYICPDTCISLSKYFSLCVVGVLVCTKRHVAV